MKHGRNKFCASTVHVINIGTLTEDDAPKTYRFMCTNVSGETLNLTRDQRRLVDAWLRIFESGDIPTGGNKVLSD